MTLKKKKERKTATKHPPVYKGYMRKFSATRRGYD